MNISQSASRKDYESICAYFVPDQIVIKDRMKIYRLFGICSEALKLPLSIT